MADPNEGAPLLWPEKTGNVPDYQYAPPPSTEPPPPSNPMAPSYVPPPQPQYQAGTGYYGQYPPTYQYGGDKQQQHTNVIVHQQPTTAVTTVYEQRLYTREDYNSRIVILFICSAFAFIFCWPLGLVACILSCIAVSTLNQDHNPRPMMTAALIFIILSFVVGIPLTVLIIVLRS